MQLYLNIFSTILIVVTIIILLYITLRKAPKNTLKAKRLNDIELYCYECETETSVNQKNNNFHCANCGLKH